MPETKIRLSHVKKTKNVCPTSGCPIKRNKIGARRIKLKKYL